MAPRPIIIDCDPGIDDAVALLLAFASDDELALRAITTVAGNVPLDLTERNARRVRRLAHRDAVPVYRGCARPLLRPLQTTDVHGATGLDGAGLAPAPAAPSPRHAVDVLIEAVTASPDALTVCALGPLTNLAVALIKRPDIATGIREIVLMGGGGGAGNVTPYAEFNFHVDPHAAHVVFESGIPIVMHGLDVTRQALITPHRLSAIEALQSDVSRAVAGMLGHYNRGRADKGGGPLHDPLVIAYLLRPALFSGQPRHVAIETDANDHIGQSIVSAPKDAIAANATFVDRVDADGFFALLVERLARFT